MFIKKFLEVFEKNDIPIGHPIYTYWMYHEIDEERMCAYDRSEEDKIYWNRVNREWQEELIYKYLFSNKVLKQLKIRFKYPLKIKKLYKLPDDITRYIYSYILADVFNEIKRKVEFIPSFDYNKYLECPLRYFLKELRFKEDKNKHTCYCCNKCKNEPMIIKIILRNHDNIHYGVEHLGVIQEYLLINDFINTTSKYKILFKNDYNENFYNRFTEERSYSKLKHHKSSKYIFPEEKEKLLRYLKRADIQKS
jgi:hypothetical protein